MSKNRERRAKRQAQKFEEALTNPSNKAFCKYCNTAIVWIARKPYLPDGAYHKCSMYVPPKKTEVKVVTDNAIVQELADLREEIEFMKRLVNQRETPKQSPTNDHEKRIIRLEEIVVSIRSEMPQPRGRPEYD